MKEIPEVTGYRHKEMTDQTMTETTNVESKDGGDREVTTVDVKTQTTDNQSHDVGTESLNVKNDKVIADSLVDGY